MKDYPTKRHRKFYAYILLLVKEETIIACILRCSTDSVEFRTGHSALRTDIVNFLACDGFSIL